MLVILKRGAILFLALMVMVSFLIFTLRGRWETPRAAGQTIVIDAGHGEPDGGASGKNGVLEKDLNLAIAKKLNENLTETGLATKMTRTDDRSLYGEEKTIREKKRADMRARLSIINGEDTFCFVSIHMNHFKDPASHGAQVFYAAHVPQSRVLAEKIRAALLRTLGEEAVRETKPLGDTVYLMKNARVPAALVECGFLSNPTEEKLLCEEDYREKLAASIAEGIRAYVGV